MGELYRYISFETFVDMVQTGELTLVHPDRWEDKYEGYFFRAMQTTKGFAKIKEGLGNRFQSWDWDNIGRVWESSRCQSWSTEGDSVAMWSIYNYNNKAIMIETTADILRGLENVDLEKVQYFDINSLGEEIKECVFDDDKSLNVSRILHTKRKAFEHEREYRITANIAVMMNRERWQNDDGKSCRVGVGEIKDFIKRVLVHPSAPDWYVEIVKKYCEINGLECSGKSQLYEFKV